MAMRKKFNYADLKQKYDSNIRYNILNVKDILNTQMWLKYTVHNKKTRLLQTTLQQNTFYYSAQKNHFNKLIRELCI